MDNQTEDFDKILDSQAEKRRLQNFDDLQNEMAGVDVGRIGRFLSPEARAIILNKRNGKVSGSMTALDLMLLNDPAYADIYNNAMDFLSKAERATEQKLIKLETQLSNSQAALKSILENTASLHDGRKVFQDTEGLVWDEHQNPVDETIANKINWNGSEPNYNTYLKHQKHIEDLKESIHNVRVYQIDILGKARDDLTDRDDPKSIEDIKVIKERMHELAPTSLRSELELKPESTTVNDMTSNFSISEPKL